jgi:hypothetical protein
MWQNRLIQQKERVTYLTLSSETLVAASGVKLKIALPGGVLSFVDIDPGTCSVELNEDQGSDILEITERWPTTGLNTRNKHQIGVLIRMPSDFSG